MRLLLIIAVPIFLVSACASAPEITAPVTVDPTFTLYGSSRHDIEVQVALRATQREGRVMLCAAIAGQADGALQASVQGYIEEWRDDSQIDVGGDRVGGGISHAALYVGEGGVRGRLATCRITDENWQAGDVAAHVTFRMNPPSDVSRTRDLSTAEIAAGVVYGVVSLALLPFYPGGGSGASSGEC